MKLLVKVLKGAEDLELPKYETDGAAGMDLRSNVNLVIKPGKVELVKTGLIVEVPKGYELQVRSRSGLALKKQVFCLNSPGTVDSDYRGEVGVILMNLGTEDFEVKRGDRIAQAVIAKHETVEIEVVDELSSTERGEGGFGSTGVTNKQ